MATAIINIPIGKSLFERLLNSKKNNNWLFNKTINDNTGESTNRIFDINPSIFYSPFEIIIDYDITGLIQAKSTIAFFCCRNTQESNNPSIHVFSANKQIAIDMSCNGSSDRITTGKYIDNYPKATLRFLYNNGIISFYINDKLINTYDNSSHKITSGLSNKCSVGMSYTTLTNTMSNPIKGYVNVKIKKLNI